PAGDGLRIAVEGAQVGIQPVGAARAADQREIGRGHAEPLLGGLRVHGTLHRLADLLAGEEQVVLDLLLVEAELLEPAVAHVLHALAAQAVVDVELGAGLQADEVGRLVRRLVEAIAGFRAERRERCEENGQEEAFHARSQWWYVTRSGTGFTLSRAVYQGMRKKNRK